MSCRSISSLTASSSPVVRSNEVTEGTPNVSMHSVIQGSADEARVAAANRKGFVDYVLAVNKKVKSLSDQYLIIFPRDRTKLQELMGSFTFLAEDVGRILLKSPAFFDPGLERKLLGYLKASVDAMELLKFCIDAEGKSKGLSFVDYVKENCPIGLSSRYPEFYLLAYTICNNESNKSNTRLHHDPRVKEMVALADNIKSISRSLNAIPKLQDAYKKIPNWFLDGAIDGVKRRPGGQFVFDDESHYLKAWTDAFAIALSKCNPRVQSFTFKHYLEIHTASLKGLKAFTLKGNGGSGGAAALSFSHLESTLTHCYSEISNNVGVVLHNQPNGNVSAECPGYPFSLIPSAYDLDAEGMADLSSGSSTAGLNYIASSDMSILDQKGWMPYSFTHAPGGTNCVLTCLSLEKVVRKKAPEFFEAFNSYIKANADAAKGAKRLVGYLWLVREMFKRHIFLDGNGRVANIVLMSLIANDPDLPMSVLYDPNILCLNGLEKVCYRLLEGMISFVDPKVNTFKKDSELKDLRTLHIDKGTHLAQVAEIRKALVEFIHGNSSVTRGGAAAAGGESPSKKIWKDVHDEIMGEGVLY